MSKKPINLPFNKSGMSVRDLIHAADTLDMILRAFDYEDGPDGDPEELFLRVKQVRNSYELRYNSIKDIVS